MCLHGFDLAFASRAQTPIRPIFIGPCPTSLDEDVVEADGLRFGVGACNSSVMADLGDDAPAGDIAPTWSNVD